jgi:hypothetical protein
MGEKIMEIINQLLSGGIGILIGVIFSWGIIIPFLERRRRE